MDSFNIRLYIKPSHVRKEREENSGSVAGMVEKEKRRNDGEKHLDKKCFLY